MHLTLPLPPPANHYKKLRVVGGHPQWYLTKRAKAFYSATADLGQSISPLLGPVTLTVRIFRQHRRGDWDGFVKCVCDALQGIAYVNDSQIDEAHVYRREDKKNPRVEVDVCPSQIDNTQDYKSLPLFDASDYERPKGKTGFAALATPNYRAPNEPPTPERRKQP